MSAENLEVITVLHTLATGSEMILELLIKKDEAIAQLTKENEELSVQSDELRCQCEELRVENEQLRRSRDAQKNRWPFPFSSSTP